MTRWPERNVAFRIKQPAIAKIERRADMYVRTLRGVIKAMGGDMEILAVFPEGRVTIKQFRELRPQAAA